MSIIHSFDPSDAILSPSHFASPIEGFPETVIVIFDSRIHEIFLEKYACEPYADLTFGFTPIYKLDYKGKSLAYFLYPIGAPATVALLEEALVTGARKILVFGTSGSLDNSLTDGRVVVPTHAYRDEGTSYHYMPAEAGDYVEVKTAAKMESMLNELEIPYITGRTWTTDGLFRETRRNMQARRADGCITVEMECAAIMAMAEFRGVEAYQFLFTADNLDADEWESRMLGELPGDASEQYIRIALELAVKL